MKNKFHLYQNVSQLNLTILPMRYISYVLNKLEKHYWLAGGTLLGKQKNYSFFFYRSNVYIFHVNIYVIKRLVSTLWYHTIYSRCRFRSFC